jgi:hypothetical protein
MVSGMDTTWRRLLVRQKGLLTAAQAFELGLPRATLHRRTRGERPPWQRVLPRVYATFAHPLTFQQKVVAAWLYGGPGAALTGGAALHWRALAYLPTEVKGIPVDIVVPGRRQCASIEFVRVARSERAFATTTVDHVPCVIVARAVADCSRRLSSYDTVLAVVASALNSSRTTLDELCAEVAAGSNKGSRLLRRVLMEASQGVRSVPESRLLALLLGSGLPEPLVNAPLTVDGQVFVPDLRWGRLIVEVDSKVHHLLMPGTWAATQRRRARLEQAGYHVIPVTPEMIRDDPSGVLAMILVAYQAYAV